MDRPKTKAPSPTGSPVVVQLHPTPATDGPWNGKQQTLMRLSQAARAKLAQLAAGSAMSQADALDTFLRYAPADGLVRFVNAAKLLDANAYAEWAARQP